jgi:hypothetical protein
VTITSLADTGVTNKANGEVLTTEVFPATSYDFVKAAITLSLPQREHNL